MSGGPRARRFIEGAVAARLRDVHDSFRLIVEHEDARVCVIALCQQISCDDAPHLITRFAVRAGETIDDHAAAIEEKAREVLWYAGRADMLQEFDRANAILAEAQRAAANHDAEQQTLYWFDKIVGTRHFAVNGLKRDVKAAAAC